jgi:hypothetical protein
VNYITNYFHLWLQPISQFMWDFPLFHLYSTIAICVWPIVNGPQQCNFQGEPLLLQWRWQIKCRNSFFISLQELINERLYVNMHIFHLPFLWKKKYWHCHITIWIISINSYHLCPTTRQERESKDLWDQFLIFKYSIVYLYITISFHNYHTIYHFYYTFTVVHNKQEKWMVDKTFRSCSRKFVVWWQYNTKNLYPLQPLKQW